MDSYNNLEELQTALSVGKITCVQIVSDYLENIKKNKHLNTFLEVFEKDALAQAKEIDNKVKSNKAGKLYGLVIGLKDNICYKGHSSSASSKILAGFENIYHSTVAERLLKEDAIIIGRLNCDEFAMGSSNENSAFGNVLNPIDNSRVPGGSSGGSAAAVAAGLCMAALGSDTGGSIRQPASFCGVVGFKPTYGRVSRYGLIAYASSYDQIGTFTKTIKDAAAIMEVISGHDEHDATCVNKEVEKYATALSFSKKAKIAYPEDVLRSEGVQPEVKESMIQLIEKLKSEGHAVEAFSFPYIDYMVPAYYVLTTAEASSNLARYDGVHYGYRSPEAKDMDSVYKKSRSEGFGKEVKRRIMTGTFVLSEGYYDAYYGTAQKVRRIIHDKTIDVFNNYDFILMPTTPSVAFKFGEKANDPIAMYLADIFTVQANHAGIPAISLPLNKNNEGLPFGTQLMANKFEEAKLFAFSDYLMKQFAEN